MSFLSNSIPQTPFFKFVSHKNICVFKSNIFTSPLSYPAATTLCYELCALPKATVQQSGVTSDSAGSNEITGVFCRGSHNLTDPSLPPLTI